jgi:3D-(3,5/4)-trihydroxycyclohexane-1,2-dione acylhydrolase (decyclizing)
MSKTIQLTVAEALARYLRAQRIEIDGREEALFGCAFAIFGHGNVTCLSEPLKDGADELPVWRGQNEQSMALAAVAYAKANRRRRIGVVTTSIGPGATNLITAAGVAHTNRLPILMLCGDAHVGRLPDRCCSRWNILAIRHSPSTMRSSRWCVTGTAWSRHCSWCKRCRRP